VLASAGDFFCRALRLRGVDEIVASEVVDLGEGRPLPNEPLAVRLTFGSAWVDEDGDEVEHDDEMAKLTIVVDSAPFPDEFGEDCGIFITTMTRKMLGAGRDYLLELPQYSVKMAKGRFFRMRFLISRHVKVTLTAKIEAGAPKGPALAVR
jgi:hypothetical protein